MPEFRRNPDVTYQLFPPARAGDRRVCPKAPLLRRVDRSVCPGLPVPVCPCQGQTSLSQGAVFAPRGQIRLSRSARMTQTPRSASAPPARNPIRRIISKGVRMPDFDRRDFFKTAGLTGLALAPQAAIARPLTEK